MIQLKPGDSIKRMVTVVKTRKNVPTVIKVEGRKYTLIHEDTHIPGKTKKGVESDGRVIGD